GTCWDLLSGLKQGQQVLFEVYGDPLVHPHDESYWGNVNPIEKMHTKDSKKLVDVLEHQFDVVNKQFALLTQGADLVAQAKELEQQAKNLRGGAGTLSSKDQEGTNQASTNVKDQ
nr:hypothetical protein [Tanacetum cinerariifolium]